MTSTKQPKPEQNGPQQLNEAALDRAAAGGGIFVAGGDVNGDGRGGNTVYVGGASGGVWKTTNF